MPRNEHATATTFPASGGVRTANPDRLLVSVLKLYSLQALCGCRAPCQPDAVAGLYSKTIVEPNITCLTIDSIDLQLDAYLPARQLGGPPWVKFPEGRTPVLLYIHGGGWTSLNRSVRNLNFLPYVEKGWAVENIDCRLLHQAPFPACIANCRQALNWIFENADKYRFPTSRIVVSGESAGGHLDLITGFITNDADSAIPNHPINRKLKMSAIINWFGVRDVKKLMEFWNSPGYVTNLVGDLSKMDEFYRSCSP